MAGRLQNEDLKSVAELAAQGCGPDKLPNDDKIYLTASGLNKTLKAAIEAGDLSGGASTYARAGEASFVDGTSSLVVAFSSAVANTNYEILPQLQNLVDTDPAFHTVQVVAKTVNGFTVKVNGIVDGNNFKVVYILPGTQLEMVVSALADAQQTIVMTLPIAMQNTNFAPIAKVQNLVDSSPSFYDTTIIAKTTTTVTVKTNAPVDSANYQMVLFAAAYV